MSHPRKQLSSSPPPPSLLSSSSSSRTSTSLKGPIHDQSCCATLRVVQHDWPCMVPINLIVNGQTCVAQNNFAQHDWSCMGRITRLFWLQGSYWNWSFNFSMVHFLLFYLLVYTGSIFQQICYHQPFQLLDLVHFIFNYFVWDVKF
jgi:hypothetical protein